MRALENAGRQDELPAVYEHEARTNSSYLPLVSFLARRRLLDEAERWARSRR